MVSAGNLAFVDVESTGLNPSVHQPWEIAVILREPGLPDEEHVWQIRPDLDKADAKALEVGRYRERFAVPDGFEATSRAEPDGGVWLLRAHEAAMEIQDMLRDAHMVAAVPSFDDGMLKALMGRWDYRIFWNYRLICAETLVCGALRQPVPSGLKAAADAMGVRYDAGELHTALGDARLARSIYDAVMSR